MKRPSLAAAVVICASLAVACGGSAPWFTPRSPKLQVSVTAGCPATDASYADVVNTFRGPPLVPPRPTAGLVCRHGARAGSGLGENTLVRSTRLDQPQAERLVEAVRQLDLAKPSGVFHCPADIGSAAVIGLSYADRADVGLWYWTSGCQTVDNGRLAAFQGANPSFGRFETPLGGMSPPPPGR